MIIEVGKAIVWPRLNYAGGAERLYHSFPRSLLGDKTEALVQNSMRSGNSSVTSPVSFLLLIDTLGNWAFNYDSILSCGPRVALPLSGLVFISSAYVLLQTTAFHTLTHRGVIWGSC